MEDTAPTHAFHGPIDTAQNEIKKSLAANLQAADDWIFERFKDVAASSGTTAVTAILSASSVITGHVGDSRAVLGRKNKGADVYEREKADYCEWKAVELTADHKPDVGTSEYERIMAAGGMVLPGDVHQGRGAAVKAGKMALQMSRSIGDHGMSRAVVINEPTMGEIR